MARMNEYMKKTQALTERMRRTTERQKLMQDHMQSMREGVAMMQGMGGDSKQREDMMQRRMDMMEMMTDEMVQHQQTSQPVQSK